MTSTSNEAEHAGDATHDASGGDVERVQRLAEARIQVVEQLHRRIVGQGEAIELLLVALFARGHGLLVGVPGLAKTSLVASLAEALSLSSNRIQFTPDLMPSDITGTDVLEQDQQSGERHFRFVPGPIFTNVLLADEINRTPPKTQAALLQAMEERQVTAGGRTHAIERPYLVFATQNPIEQEGTYPLPEAQLDRFMLQINMDYPGLDDELEIVKRTTAPTQSAPTPVLHREEILAMQELVRRVPVADHVVAHAVALVRATRPEEQSAPETIRRFLSFGGGPRASQALILGAKARAVLSGRFAAEVEDVRALALPILRHRLVTNFRAEAEGVRGDTLIASLLEAVVP
ncbi:MAG: MoxR family ATPase [Myxococcales bacterium]|nr:MoxR family ATPase [Myxococcales bacterium]MDD9970408.1 MoxR family ATPase [Myxococcales bacterium]